MLGAPQAIIDKYHLRDDLRKLNLDAQSPRVQSLFESDPMKGITSEEKFFRELSSAVTNKHKAQGYNIAGPKDPDIILLREMKCKLLIGVAERECSLVHTNKEDLALQKADLDERLQDPLSDPDLSHILDQCKRIKNS